MDTDHDKEVSDTNSESRTTAGHNQHQEKQQQLKASEAEEIDDDSQYPNPKQRKLQTTIDGTLEWGCASSTFTTTAASEGLNDNYYQVMQISPLASNTQIDCILSCGVSGASDDSIEFQGRNEVTVLDANPSETAVVYGDKCPVSFGMKLTDANSLNLIASSNNGLSDGKITCWQNSCNGLTTARVQRVVTTLWLNTVSKFQQQFGGRIGGY